MFSNNLENIEWLGIFAILSMAFFIVMFVLVVVYIIKIDRKKIEEVERLPLEE